MSTLRTRPWAPDSGMDPGPHCALGTAGGSASLACTGATAPDDRARATVTRTAHGARETLRIEGAFGAGRRSPCLPGLSAEEGEEAGLLVRGLGRVELGAEGVGRAQDLIHRRHPFADPSHLVAVEALVPAGGPGQVPRMDHDVGAEEAVDRVLELGRPEHRALVLGTRRLGVVEGG